MALHVFPAFVTDVVLEVRAGVCMEGLSSGRREREMMARTVLLYRYVPNHLHYEVTGTPPFPLPGLFQQSAQGVLVIHPRITSHPYSQ